MAARNSGLAEMHPISTEHPLGNTRHWIAAHQFGQALNDFGNPIQAFYNPLGMVLLGTVTDNDCGLDTMCMTLQLPQNEEQPTTLRGELSDYLLDRLEQPCMHGFMAAVCESMATSSWQPASAGSHCQPKIQL